MTIAYTLKISDFYAAYKLHRKQKLSRRITYAFWPALTLLCLAGFFVFAMLRHQDLMALCLSVGAGSLVGTIGMPIARFINIRKSYQRLFPHDRKEILCVIDIDDDRILREVVGVSQTKILWTGINGFAQNERITLLYTSKDCFYLFPTQALSSEERTQLNAMVAHHVVRNS